MKTPQTTLQSIESLVGLSIQYKYQNLQTIEGPALQTLKRCQQELDLEVKADMGGSGQWEQ